MPSYREEEITSIQNFVALIDDEKNKAEKSGNDADLLFRGQPEDWPLLPKLARLKLRGELDNIEQLIIEEFERTSLPLSEFQPSDDWDLLALAQHHGLPTRLLDWTYSALVAVWFAVKDVPSDGNDYGIVWVLIPEVDDFRADTERYGPLSNKITKIFRPKIISRRISAQSGVFTVHKINDGGRVIKFETNRNFSKKLLKVKIPVKHHPSIRQRLNMLGVNSASVFPDIDGLCAHLQWRYTYLKDETRSKKTLTRRSSGRAKGARR